MHFVLGTTAQALAEQEALRRELTPGSGKSPSPYTHLLSPEKRPGSEGSQTLDRALSLGVLVPNRT